MGAELWYHEVPWRPDAADALRAFQVEFFRSRYNFADQFRLWANSTRDALKSERESGDRFGLVDTYERSAKVIAQFESTPLPTEPLEQIAVLRRVIETVSPDGFGNILDVTGVNDKGGTHCTRRLAPDEVRKKVGADRPTLEQSTIAIDRIARELGRCQSACFEYFRETTTPAGWFFVGYTLD